MTTFFICPNCNELIEIELTNRVMTIDCPICDRVIFLIGQQVLNEKHFRKEKTPCQKMKTTLSI